MYDPQVGRFLEDDPKEFAAGDPNLYRYVENNPSNKTDPSGLLPAGNNRQNDPLLKMTAEELLDTQKGVVRVDITPDGKFMLIYPSTGSLGIPQTEVIDYKEALNRIWRAKNAGSPRNQKPPSAGNPGAISGGTLLVPPSYRNNLNPPLDRPGLMVTESPEQRALGILQKMGDGWEKSGYVLAAHLLRHFLAKKGPAPYDIEKGGDLGELRSRARRMVGLVVTDYIDQNKKKTYLAPFFQPPECPKGGEIKVDAPLQPIRWIPERLLDGLGYTILSGTVHHKEESTKFYVPDDALFYAIGGAKMGVSGAVRNWEPERGWGTIKAKVTIEDTYDFGEDPFGLRSAWSKQYAAGHYLQKVHAYKPWHYTVSYTDEFKYDFVLNRIVTN